MSEFTPDVYHVRATDAQAADYEDPLLGVAVAMPEAGVYVDWRRESFTDPLDEPHVSEYGSLDDLVAATGNAIEPVGDATAQETLPDTCRVCGDRQRAPGSMTCPACEPDQQAVAGSEFEEGDAVTWTWDGEPVHGRVAEVRPDQYTPPAADEPITGDGDEPVYVIDEWDDDVEAYRRRNVGKGESSLDESQRDLPPRADDNYAAAGPAGDTGTPLDTILAQAVPVPESEFTVRELDYAAHQADVLSRTAGAGGAVLWASADGAIAYFADLPDKYREAIGEAAFVPSKGMYEAAKQALEWYDEHPDEFEAGADDGEGIRRARQIVRHYEEDEPLAPEYVVEIRAYLRRSDAQEGRAELDADVPDAEPWLDPGYTAHLLWGGDAGLAWAEELVDRMEAVDERAQAAGPGDAAPSATTLAPVSQAAATATAAGPDAPLGDVTKAGTNEIDVAALPDEYQAALEADDFYVYGKASIEQFDREEPPHSIKIKMDALEAALERYFESEEAPGIISLVHDDIPVGVPVREHTLDAPATLQLETPDGEPEQYQFDAGDTLTTHVEDGDGDGRPELWLLSNLASDSEIAKETRLRALQGQLDGYSVTIHRNDDERTDQGRIVTACDLHAVTLGTSEIVKNAGSTFDVAEYQAFGAAPATGD